MGMQGLLKRTILAEEPDLMPGAFDLIIVDEAHRGYILDREMTEEEILYDNQDDYMSKYKQVIEYFDAVKVALTATPALHTTEIFGEPVYTYSYREAVIDGWLVDHDPPYLINTDFIENDAQFKKGETLAQYDPNTNELLNGTVLDDEMDFDVSEFNRKIVLPDHTRKVLEEVSTYLNPESGEKTLIFAVNDAHADRIVDTLREIYKPYGISNDAIIKITLYFFSINRNFAGDQANNFAVELRHIEIHFIVQNCTVQKFIGVGVILRQGFTLLELCVIFNEIRINQIWRVMIHQPAIDNRLTVAVGIDRLPENLGRVQGGRSSQGNFHRIEILDNLLVLAHIIILIIVEDFFFRHFTVKNIASVGFVHNNQIKCTGHQIRFFCQNRAFQKPLHTPITRRFLEICRMCAVG